MLTSCSSVGERYAGGARDQSGTIVEHSIMVNWCGVDDALRHALEDAGLEILASSELRQYAHTQQSMRENYRGQVEERSLSSSYGGHLKTAYQWFDVDMYGLLDPRDIEDDKAFIAEMQARIAELQSRLRALLARSYAGLRHAVLHYAMDRIVDRNLRAIKEHLWRPDGRLVQRQQVEVATDGCSMEAAPTSSKMSAAASAAGNAAGTRSGDAAACAAAAGIDAVADRAAISADAEDSKCAGMARKRTRSQLRDSGAGAECSESVWRVAFEKEPASKWESMPHVELWQEMAANNQLMMG